MVSKLELIHVVTPVTDRYFSTAPSTLAILGVPLSAKHGSYRNKRALQDAVRAGKEKEAPAGLQWNGKLKLSLRLVKLRFQVNSQTGHSRCRRTV
jgi:hypothetical protein